MRYCKITDLQDDMMLARPVLLSNGGILLQANVRLTPYLINRLRFLKFKGVYIFDDVSRGIFDKSNLPLDVQIDAINAVSVNDIDSITYLANALVDKLQNVDIINTDLSALNMFDNYTYVHSVNVATYCGILGLKLGLDSDKLKDLVTAAMLHDIGKIDIPLEILNKPDQLTDEEYEIIKTHSRLGYKTLQDNDNVKSVVRVSVLEHHENWDGTGYPNNIRGDNIYYFARIIHVCDVYDALISERVYKPAKPPGEVVEYILANGGILFDNDIVHKFISSLVIYPDGTSVTLSDGNNYIVARNNKGFPLRPVVRHVKTGKEVDLLNVNSLVILDYDL